MNQVSTSRTPSRRSKTPWAPYLFLAPFLILFMAFGMFPLLFSLVLSLHEWSPSEGIEAMKFVAAENFQFAIADQWLWKSMWNTFWLAATSGMAQHLVAIPLAYFLFIAFGRFRNAVVGVYFLPFITSTVAISLIFTTLFSTDYGVINLALTSLSQAPGLGLFFPEQNVDWMGKAENVKPAVAMVVFWRYVGFNTVLYLSALQTIPKDLFEAATIDGANRWRQFRYIAVPMLRPMMVFGITLSIIGGLQLFEEPFIITGGRGGVDQSAMTTAVYMYRTAFEFNDFGTASAISWILFVVIAALTLITNKIFVRTGMKDA